MRHVDNPPNPYTHEDVEWLGEPPKADVQIYEEDSRTILSRNDSPDIPFRWSLNPYRGCLHACAYCYARPDHERLGWGAGSDFETRLVVKVRAPELLRRELGRQRWQGELICFSGDTDCYQPVEACYKLTRRCLEICEEYRNPVSIITKSALVQRDAELLGRICRASPSGVTMSLPFLDADVARAVEPGTPTPRLRLQAMKALADAGVPVSVLVAPIIPGLNDREIPEILGAAKAAGAIAAGKILLRLPGSLESVFFSRLKAALPDRADRVEARLKEARAGDLGDNRTYHRMTGQGTYWKAIEDLFSLHVARLKLNRRTEPATTTTFRRPEQQLDLF